MLQQHYQNLERLFLKLDLEALLAQLTCSKIKLEGAEVEDLCGPGVRHRGPILNVVASLLSGFSRAKQFLRL
jgi:hypothetical protein